MIDDANDGSDASYAFCPPSPAAAGSAQAWSRSTHDTHTHQTLRPTHSDPAHIGEHDVPGARGLHAAHARTRSANVRTPQRIGSGGKAKWNMRKVFSRGKSGGAWLC